MAVRPCCDQFDACGIYRTDVEIPLTHIAENIHAAFAAPAFDPDPACCVSLSGCDSGGDGDKQAQIRLLNVSPGYSSLDLYVQDDAGNDNLKFGAVASGSISDYTAVDSVSYTLKLKREGITSTLLTLSDRSLADGARMRLTLPTDTQGILGCWSSTRTR
jgi:hypothetical protein